MGLADDMLSDVGGSTAAPASGNQPMYADVDAKYGFPTGTMASIAHVESNNNPRAVSPKGAQGIFQIMPATQRNPGFGMSSLDPNNPDDAGAYLAAMVRNSGGDLATGIAKYNAGPAGHLNNPETNAYVQKVTAGIPQMGNPTTQLGGPTPPISNISAPAANSNAPQSPIQNSAPMSGLAASMMGDLQPVQKSAGSAIPQVGAATSQANTTNPILNAPSAASTMINPAQGAVDYLKGTGTSGALKGAGETALQMGTGALASAGAGLKGLYDLASGESLDKVAQNIRDTEQQYTYQPRTQEGQQLSQAVGNVMGGVAQGAGAVGGTIGQTLGGEQGRIAGQAIGEVAPAVAMTVGGGLGLKGPAADMAPGILGRGGQAAEASTTLADMAKPRLKLNNDGSVTPVNAPNSVMPSSPIAQQIEQAKSNLAANQPSLTPTQIQRHSEAGSLPVPVALTDAQASGNPVAISNELNTRAKYPNIAADLNAQNGALVDNLNAIRAKVAPNASDIPENNAQAIIDAYKAKDAAVTQDISNKYQALKDANGGQFPLSGQQFVANADAALKADNVTAFLPTPVAGILNDLRNGGPMSFNDFENYRTILGQQGRLADRSGDGTASHAISVVRNSLESLPMSDEAAAIKPLADQARAAVAARFNTLSSDPAYKAAVSDDVPIGTPSPLTNNFINKYITGGKTAYVQNMMNNLADDPLAQQAIKAGMVDSLRSASGIDLRTGSTPNFSQAGLNKAIQNSGNKLQTILGPDADIVNTLGNVARYTQEQPRGSFVNNSNTLTSSLGDLAKTGAEFHANMHTGGLYNVGKGIVQNMLNSNKRSSVVKLSDLQGPPSQ